MRGPLTVFTANLYFGPNVPTAENASQEWEGTERRTNTLSKITNLSKAAIFCFQEVTGPMRVDIASILEATHTIFYAVTNSKRGFGLMTCVPKKYQAALDESFAELIGAPPPGWARGFLPVLIEKHVMLINLHASTQREHRDKMCLSLALALERRHPGFIVCGDFNSFPDDGGVELIHDMQHLSGGYEATSVIVETNDKTKRVIRTFQPYPDDVFAKIQDTVLPYNLDHVLVKGLRIDEIPKGHIDTLGRCSDHMMIEVKLTFI